MKKLLTVLFYLCFFVIYSQTQSITLPTVGSTATFTVPSGVTKITVECWGAGGRGGTRTSSGGGGGGGGGAYSRKIYNVNPGDTFSYFIGPENNTTNAGATTWFSDINTHRAVGGNSVADNVITGALGGNAVDCVGEVVRSGGNGANASGSDGGGGGSSAGFAAAGNTATNSTGATAPVGGGNGGNGRTGFAGDGSSGVIPGGGGGGARRGLFGTQNGGNGAAGRILITYTDINLDVFGNGVLIVDGGAGTPAIGNHTDFGNVALTGSFVRTFTITNTSVENILTIGSFTIGGANASEFTLLTTPATSLNAGASTTFQVRFMPTALGVRNATISFVNNSSTGKNPYNFNLSGTGVNIPSPTHTIYYESFDISDGGWTSSTVPGRNGSWTRSTSPLIGQGSYFRTNPYATFSKNSGMYLTSPVINLTGFQDIHFSLDIRHELSDNGDGVQVQYSTDGGITWNVLNSSITYDFWYTNSSIGGLGNTAGWNGTNAENANSPSKFVEGTCAFKGLDNQSNIRFRIYFSDNNNNNLGNGVAIDNIVIRGNPIVPLGNPTAGPAGVNNNLKLWLNSLATGVSYQDGDDVTSWNDSAFDNHAFAYGSFAPKFRNNSLRNINFNPIIDFNRSASTHLKGKGGYWTNEYFVVVQTNSMFDKTQNNSMVPLSGKFTKDAMGQDGTGLALGRVSSRFNGDALISHLLSTYAQSGSPGTNSYGRSFAPSSISSMGQDIMIINVKSNTSVTPAITEIYINGKRVDNHTATVGTTGTGTPLIHADVSNLI